MTEKQPPKRPERPEREATSKDLSKDLGKWRKDQAKRREQGRS